MQTEKRWNEIPVSFCPQYSPRSRSADQAGIINKIFSIFRSFPNRLCSNPTGKICWSYRCKSERRVEFLMYASVHIWRLCDHLRTLCDHFRSGPSCCPTFAAAAVASPRRLCPPRGWACSCDAGRRGPRRDEWRGRVRPTPAARRPARGDCVLDWPSVEAPFGCRATDVKT